MNIQSQNITPLSLDRDLQVSLLLHCEVMSAVTTGKDVDLSEAYFVLCVHVYERTGSCTGVVCLEMLIGVFRIALHTLILMCYVVTKTYRLYILYSGCSISYLFVLLCFLSY